MKELNEFRKAKQRLQEIEEKIEKEKERRLKEEGLTLEEVYSSPVDRVKIEKYTNIECDIEEKEGYWEAINDERKAFFKLLEKVIALIHERYPQYYKELKELLEPENRHMVLLHRHKIETNIINLIANIEDEIKIEKKLLRLFYSVF